MVRSVEERRRGREEASPDEPGRGREAERPTQIPARGWRDVLRRVWQQTTRDNVDLVAAGVAFYLLLSIPPALGAVISVYGLVTDPARVAAQLEELSRAIPEGAQGVIGDQLDQLAGRPGGALTLGFVVSLGVALWATMRATKALMTACNLAHEEAEARGFVRRNAVAFLLTLGLLAFLVASLVLVAVAPAVLNFIGLAGALRVTIDVLRWPVLALLVLVSLAFLYRYAPNRRSPKWRWVSWGSGVATGLWLLLSAGFSFYVSNFGGYDEMYGSLGAVVVLLVWLYLSAYVIILGAELNAELEHQTARDTTRGPDRPMGRRDAYVADTVGR
ncbi:MAG: YihY/virulence factor BrkB family protein [Planctomycetes bacterium]|nr:YihY/virulence factor BrkB family protein [Planctomycetota bacterium]